MRIFLTGATGFIGAALVPELVQAGHQVLGLTRSEVGAAQLRAAGAEVHHGNLEDLETLRSGAEQADAVIHTAFTHDFANFAAACEQDRRAVETLGLALKGSSRPLVVTSGVMLGIPAPGQLAIEDHFNPNHPSPRTASELASAKLSDAGVNVSVVRLPQVHDPVKQGLIPYITAHARLTGIAAYIGEGANRWSAAHVSDVAHLYRLVVERAEPGSRYHAVAEEGVPFRDITEALARGLNVPVKSLAPEEAAAHFGWLAMFAGHDLSASSKLTRERLGWNPTGPSLLADLAAMDYSKA
jgi:nucleoside-diphosphate-sugar epimerase